MGWLNTTRTIHRRKATVRTNIQDGRTDIKTSSNHGSECGRILGQARQGPAERLVGQHTPQKATDARDRGAGKDGARRLGDTETRRVLHAASLVNSRVVTKVSGLHGRRV